MVNSQVSNRGPTARFGLYAPEGGVRFGFEALRLTLTLTLTRGRSDLGSTPCGNTRPLVRRLLRPLPEVRFQTRTSILEQPRPQNEPTIRARARAGVEARVRVGMRASIRLHLGLG